MKYTLAALPALAAALVAPVQAGTIEDTVRANCTKQIVASTDTTRNQIKKFIIKKIGGGYEMSGFDEHNSRVVCQTTEDGHVTWVRVN